MSFTLMRYKDGKEMPIKVSILDAFRSAPRRRPRAAKPLPVEKKKKSDNTPDPDNKPSSAKVESPKAADSDNVLENGITVKDSSNRQEEAYTAEDDAKIIAMKDEKRTWRDIKEAIGKKSESQLKNHYRLHLGPNAQEEQKKLAERIAKAEKNKAEGLVKQAKGRSKQGDGRDGDGDGDGDGGDDGDKKNGSGGGGDGGQEKVGDGGGAGGGSGKIKEKEKTKAKLQKGSKPKTNTSEAPTRENLKGFVAKREREKWLAAASRHYDLTGQRISPEMAKKMSEED